MNGSTNISLNVGGILYETTRSTLVSTNSATFFYALASNVPDSVIFIDRDGTHFRFILNWLRGSRVIPIEKLALQELCVEADFYCVPDLLDALKTRLSSIAYRSGASSDGTH